MPILIFTAMRRWILVCDDFLLLCFLLHIDVTENLFHAAYDDFSLILNDGNEEILANLADMG